MSESSAPGTPIGEGRRHREPRACCAQAGAGAFDSDLPLDLVLACVLIRGYVDLAPYFMCVLLCCAIVEVIIIHSNIYISNTIFHPRAAPHHTAQQIQLNDTNFT